LPLNVAGSSIVTDPFGAVILIGGTTGADGPAVSSIYRLRDAGQNFKSWELLTAALTTARYWPTAFLVPNSILKCQCK